MTTFGDQVFQFGGSPVGMGANVPGMFGNVYFVDYTNGNDNNLGTSMKEAFKTITKAYNTCTTNNNDVILLNGYAQFQEATMITWAKNRIHLVGLGGGFMQGQRSRIALTTAGNLLGVAATITVTGVGNTFSNLKIENSGTHASSVAAVVDAGEATVWNNCSFLKLTDLDEAAVADFICGADSTSYINCQFGFDTLTQSADRPTFWYNSTLAGARAKDLYFKHCTFLKQNSSASSLLLKVNDGNSVLFSHYFEDCAFLNTIVGGGGAQLTVAIASHAGLADGQLNFLRPYTNADSFCTTSTKVYVAAPAVSNNAFEATTPA